jgi:protocatechuate 3,4-dioxygenase beta subunit
VYPAQTEGPFYLDLDLVRTDITEGKPGTPLTVVMEIVRASDCAPLKDVAVDIWQCDAAGVYAGFPGQLGGLDTTGQRFLRGTQLTGADGKATFDTIYPGWYPGRTTHIHFKVHPTSTTEATSQMYFPEDINAQIYQTGVYAARGQKDTTNAADGVNRTAVAPLAVVTQSGGRYTATIRVTVAG